MPPAARITDPTTHLVTPLGPGPGSANVHIGYLPAWRATVDQHACPATSSSGADKGGSVLLGSPTVLINNMMACRLGDKVAEVPGAALGLLNPILKGEPTVMIGDVGMGSPVVVTPIPPLVLLGQAMAGVGAAAQSLAQGSSSGTPFIHPCPGWEALKQAAGSAAAQEKKVVSPDKTSWIEIELLDQQGKPVPNEEYQIELPDGSTVDDKLDGMGLARVDGIDPGTCKITFPNLDKRTWHRK